MFGSLSELDELIDLLGVLEKLVDPCVELLISVLGGFVEICELLGVWPLKMLPWVPAT